MKHLVITSGGTLEQWDDVRGHTNMARGHIGAFIAQIAIDEGWHVTLLHGYFAQTLPEHKKLTQQLFYGVEDLENKLRTVVQQHKNPYVVMTAAISDWTVEKITDAKGTIIPQGEKISSDIEPIIHFKKACKLLSQIKTWNKEAYVVGFKLESTECVEELVARASVRLDSSGCDAIIANSAKSLVTHENAHYFIDESREVRFVADSKENCAERLVLWLNEK
ncbi:MAG: phosphopantothenoylcysteine decarboxylase [Bacilli bacterium]